MVRKAVQASLDSRPGQSWFAASYRRKNQIFVHGAECRVQAKKLSRDTISGSAVTTIKCGERKTSQNVDVFGSGEQLLVTEVACQTGESALQEQVDELEEFIPLAVLQFLLVPFKNLLREVDEENSCFSGSFRRQQS